MKKTQLGFIALAAIIGTGSAFTVKHTAQFTGRTYAIKSENSNGTYSVSLWKTSYRCSGTAKTCKLVYPDGGTTLTLIQTDDMTILSKSPGVLQN
jgi:hypothetical protein